MKQTIPQDIKDGLIERIYVVFVTGLDDTPLGGGPSRYGEFRTREEAEMYQARLRFHDFNCFVRAEDSPPGIHRKTLMRPKY